MSGQRRERFTPHSLFVLLSSGLMALGLAGCPPIDDCERGGKGYAVGESFKDDCNTCTCTKNGIACTLIACNPQEPCRKTGCSGQVCSDKDVVTTCEYRDVYACYKTATCTRQPDGFCGFTPTAELTTCVANGGPSKDAGTGPDATATCDFADAYEYGQIGGFVIWHERSYLSPGNKYRHMRTPARATDPAEFWCSPAMPACGSEDVITAYDIEHWDLPNADVQAALAEATPPLFGVDSRPVDGTVFEFKTSKGGFLVGSDCAGKSVSGCRAIPKGIKQLVDRLRALDDQQLATAECKAVGF